MVPNVRKKMRENDKLGKQKNPKQNRKKNKLKQNKTKQNLRMNRSKENTLIYMHMSIYTHPRTFKRI